MKRIFIALALLLGVVAMPGCGVAPFIIGPAIQGYIYWKDGEARKYYKQDINVVHNNLKSVLISMGHTIDQDTASNGGWQMVSHSTNHKFKIRVLNTDPNVCCVKIRIDFMGDKPYAELVYRLLDKTLGERTVGIKVESDKHRMGRY